MLCRDEARIDQQVAKLNGVVVNLLSIFVRFGSHSCRASMFQMLAQVAWLEDLKYPGMPMPWRASCREHGAVHKCCLSGNLLPAGPTKRSKTFNKSNEALRS